MQDEEKPLEEPVQEEEKSSTDVDEYKERYLRVLADMENLKKRQQKERVEMIQYASEQLIGEFLPAIDNLENALKFADQAAPEVKNWAMGFTMILNQIKEVLAAHGVTPISAEGVFDPHLHEVVETQEEGDQPAGTILQEFTRGYRIGSRVIRPARVKVKKSTGE